MKKRLLSILLAVVMVFTLLPTVSFAAEIVDSGTCGDNLTWTLDSDGLLTISGTGPMKNYDYGYSSLKSPFCENESIQRIVIEEGVTSIGECAFFRCFNASGTLTLPASVEQVGDSAFLGCKFDSVIILNPYLSLPYATSHDGSPLGSSTTIHAYALKCKFEYPYCSAQYLAESVESFKYSFSAHEFENGVCTICGAAPYTHTEALGESLQWTYSFEDQQRLEIAGTGAIPDYTLPSYSGSSTPWGKYSAYIEDITVREGITTIGNHTFARHYKLLSVNLPDSLTEIGEYAFYDCVCLQSVVIPNSVSDIKKGAFSRCSNLKDVTLPNGLVELGDSMFSLCSALESIELPESITSIGRSAFWRSGITSINIPEGVTSIGVQTFEGCYQLTSIILPQNIYEIERFAFCDCTSLSSVYFCGDAPILADSVFVHTIGWDENNQPICENISNLILYYIEGKEGWTTPTWNGYPTATWTPEEPVTFTDVKESAWYYDAVNYAVRNGLMNGVENNQFVPENSMTRAMLVTVLWRYAGAPVVGENKFSDVQPGLWYTQAVAWAAHNGIVNGATPTKFNPNGSITREQMATILFRYAQKVGIDTSKRADLSSFPDSDKISGYAKDALSWANAEGLINGSSSASGTYLKPQGDATRAQVAAILMRFIENIAG